jgi:hypothetical protein
VAVPIGSAADTAAVHTAAAADHILEGVGADSMGFGELGLPLETWDVVIADTLETWAADRVVAVAACCTLPVPGEDMAMMVLHMGSVGRATVAGLPSPGAEGRAALQAELQAAADSGRMG